MGQGRLKQVFPLNWGFLQDVRVTIRVGQPAAGAAGLVGLLFVRLELAVDEVECHLRGSGKVQQVVAAEAVRVPLNQRNLSGGTSAKLAAGKQPVWREGRPRDRFPWHGLATTPPIRPRDTGRQRQSKMNRNTTATVGQAQRVNQTDGKCIRHPRTSSNPDGNGSRRTDSLATIRHHGRLRGRKASTTSPPKPVKQGQPARPLRRPATGLPHPRHPPPGPPHRRPRYPRTGRT
jgi:hypothetical protein